MTTMFRSATELPLAPPAQLTPFAEKLSARVAAKQHADLATYRKALVEVAEGKALPDKAMEALAATAVDLGLSARQFDDDVAVLREYRALKSNAESLRDPDEYRQWIEAEAVRLRAIEDEGKKAAIQVKVNFMNYTSWCHVAANMKLRLERMMLDNPRIAPLM